MEEHIDFREMDFLPLYLGAERLEFGTGNSAFYIYPDKIVFNSVYPFRKGLIFVLKTKEGAIQLETIEGRQVGQSDFIATMKPLDKDINLMTITRKLEQYHGGKK